MTQPAESFISNNIPKPETGRELLEVLRQSGIVGIWHNRRDISDSQEYARRLRETAQERNP